jgi:hypothetical protein
MAFDTKTLGRILKGATEIIRAASGTSRTGTAKSGTSATGKTSAGRKPAAKTTAGKSAAGKAPARPAVGRGSTSRTSARGAGSAPARTPAPPRPGTSELSSPYAGDFHGRAKAGYSPNPDGTPDPGEVVWTWVPFEEDYSQGKDRPVLLIGHNGKRLLALMLTSKDRNNGSSRDAGYVDVGTGPWDSKGRPSEVKLDRILQIDPRDIRREGAVMGRAAFDRVAKALRQLHGWS